MSYRSFPADIIMNFWGYQFGRNRGAALGAGFGGGMPPPAAAAPGMMPQARRALQMDRLANGQSRNGVGRRGQAHGAVCQGCG